MKIYDYNGLKNVAGERIHQRRTTLRISQADLSARMQVQGVTIEREAISKIETGDRFITDYELMTFAEVFRRVYGLAHRQRMRTARWGAPAGLILYTKNV